MRSGFFVVISLIYWKKPVESAIVMATGFTLLFSIGCLSLISVFAYICLAILCCTGAARVYYDLITSKRDETASPPFRLVVFSYLKSCILLKCRAAYCLYGSCFGTLCARCPLMKMILFLVLYLLAHFVRICFSDWFIKDKEALRQRVQDYVNDRFDKTESTIQELRHYLFIENYIDSLKASSLPPSFNSILIRVLFTIFYSITSLLYSCISCQFLVDSSIWSLSFSSVSGLFF